MVFVFVFLYSIWAALIVKTELAGTPIAHLDSKSITILMLVGGPLMLFGDTQWAREQLLAERRFAGLFVLFGLGSIAGIALNMANLLTLEAALLLCVVPIQLGVSKALLGIFVSRYGRPPTSLPIYWPPMMPSPEEAHFIKSVPGKDRAYGFARFFLTLIPILAVIISIKE